jgi:hypothetical protein
MNGKGLAARNAANLMTRAAKQTIEDRGALGQPVARPGGTDRI